MLKGLSVWSQREEHHNKPLLTPSHPRMVFTEDSTSTWVAETLLLTKQFEEIKHEGASSVDRPAHVTEALDLLRADADNATTADRIAANVRKWSRRHKSTVAANHEWLGLNDDGTKGAAQFAPWGPQPHIRDVYIADQKNVVFFELVCHELAIDHTDFTSVDSSIRNGFETIGPRDKRRRRQPLICQE